MSGFRSWWVSTLPHRLRLRRIVPQFLRSCPEPFRGEVLEVGAGGGWTSQRILETFPQVELTAVDIDSRATQTFERLQSEYGRRLKIKEANVLKLPFDRESFDIVIAMNVVSDLQVYGIRKAIQECIRVVRQGGLIGISETLLFSFGNKTMKEMIENIFREENCELLYSQGEKRFFLWARKPYPIEQK